jgi:hypothetical protein
MPPPFSQLLLLLVNRRSAAAAAAAVLLPPAPPACFYGGAASAMYQSLMRKHRAGSSVMTDASSLDRHDGNIDAQHRHHRPPRHSPRQQQRPHQRHQYRLLVIVLAGPTAIGKSDVAVLLCSQRLASELSVGHRLAWEGADEVVEEEEEEHAKDGMNNKLVNPAVDDGARHNRGCRRRCAAAVAAVAAIAVRSGHVVSADSVQAYCGADVGLNKPTDVELWCTPHHLINVMDPPIVAVVVVVVVVVVNDVIISYDTILYSLSKIFQV